MVLHTYFYFRPTELILESFHRPFWYTKPDWPLIGSRNFVFPTHPFSYLTKLSVIPERDCGKTTYYNVWIVPPTENVCSHVVPNCFSIHPCVLMYDHLNMVYILHHTVDSSIYNDYDLYLSFQNYRVYRKNVFSTLFWYYGADHR